MNTSDRIKRRQKAIDEARQIVADAEDEAFKLAVNADKERVLAEIRAGRHAELADWSARPDKWSVGDAK